MKDTRSKLFEINFVDDQFALIFNHRVSERDFGRLWQFHNRDIVVSEDDTYVVSRFDADCVGVWTAWVVNQLIHVSNRDIIHLLPLWR